MKHKVTNHSSLTKGFLGQVAAEKKKAVATLSLILVMAFMWFRILTNKKPEASQASLITEQLNLDDHDKQKLNVSFKELPQIAGRNDVITRDFFTHDDWRHFGSGKEHNLAVIEEVNVVSTNGNEEVIKKVAEKLKLEAIVVLGNKPRACINNKVISEGDIVPIRDGSETHECEVIEIRENTVVIKCKEAKVTLKLTQTSMIDN